MTSTDARSHAGMAAAPPSTLTAAQRVFGTAELLEMILLAATHYDYVTAPVTVLCSQRVNRNFRVTIQGSPALKRVLYLSHSEWNRQPRINPILVWFSYPTEVQAIRIPFRINYWPWSDQVDFVATKQAIKEGAGGIESWRRMLPIKSSRSTFSLRLVVDENREISAPFNIRTDITVGEFLEEGRKALQGKYPSMQW
ncbi:hypothetical protein HII31_01949 [Pseudocercospora fuligena]|uniref:Uncharacterized protein n=1 Tax=Pseudocercospora fuligena TaxID=685502 RepID=A0A8H6RSU4_9PEZI|nr:hypothetical protein HII31_01949 [Pseudocercospora fuligena]